MTEWIKCSDRLPDSEPDFNVHKVYLTFGILGIGASTYDNLNKRVWIFQQITHWAIPPETPDQIEKKREEYEKSDYCKALTKYVDRFFERYKVPLEVKND